MNEDDHLKNIRHLEQFYKKVESGDYEGVFIGRKYRVVGVYKNGFEGECVSYNPEEEFSVNLQDENFCGWAGKESEIEEII